MPVFERFPPVKISCFDGNSSISCVSAGSDQRNVQVHLAEREKIFVRTREGDWCKVRHDLRARSRILWKWSAPLVSMASNLAVLNVYTPEKGRREGYLELTSPNEDEYILHLEMNDLNGIVLRPKYVVALSSGISVRTHWSFNVHNLFSGRIRQIIYYGKGSVFIRGGNGLDLRMLENSGSDAVFKVEDGALIGYAVSAHYSLCRTETFLPYLLHRTSLTDYRLQHGLFITQNQEPKADRKK